MKYFIDTEFLEGTQKETFPISLFRKETPPTIDLISIGIVSEDGREYYTISKDFNLKEAWNRFQIKDYDLSVKKEYWIRENVLKPIWKDYLENKQSMYEKTYHWELTSEFSYKTMKTIIGWIGKTNKEIAEGIKEFIYTTSQINNPETIANFEEVKYLFPISFYAYYADYDWVAFCWLFGKMIELPKGFPKYCNDLKQIFDEKQNYLKGEAQYIDLKLHTHCPQPENEHNALADARWNKKLHDFLITIPTK